MIVDVPIEIISHLVEDRIYIPDDKFQNSKLFPKEPLVEYWPFLNRYYGKNSRFPNFNEYLSSIDMLNDINYFAISTQDIFCFNDSEFFEFDFPDESIALYFKMKYCS